MNKKASSTNWPLLTEFRTVPETAAWSVACECWSLQGVGRKAPHVRAEGVCGGWGAEARMGASELTAPELTAMRSPLGLHSDTMALVQRSF